ncbi:Dynactin subunit 1 isoform X1 [Phytophthora megakarya]|uniref:Dynactin subunit 1 isoform X1 n=1 Tax=Phytophthora megakarya TaxID=4795 RepID=A0A225VMV0_9STRA|nr:Dynactin subunit 1 isoform X1 [Phytophthora megakarya]
MASSIPKPRTSLTTTQALSPVMKVPLSSRVVLSRRRNGTVKYVGKLINESGEWYGVALDEPKGDCDGMRGKERYFFCPPNYGIFVRRKEIYCSKEPISVFKGPPSPVTDEGSSCSSSASIEQPSEMFSAVGTGIVHSVSSTNNAISPLMKTFKGFRKQLDFISLKTIGPGRSRDASPVATLTSSTPSSPTARSGLKPPSPFRRFVSFSQDLPIPPNPVSPTNKTPTASPDNRRRQSAISSSPKASLVRRTNSFRVSTPDKEDFTRPILPSFPPPLSSNRFTSFQNSGTQHFSISEDNANATFDELTTRTPILHSKPPATNETKYYGIQSTAEDKAINPTQPVASDTNDYASKRASPLHQSELIIDDQIKRFTPVEEAVITIPTTDQSVATLTAVKNSRLAVFHVPPIDTTCSREIVLVSEKASPAPSSPRDIFGDSPRNSPRSLVPETKSEVTQILTEKARSIRLAGRSSSFQIPSLEVSPASSPENSPSRRSNNRTALLFDGVTVLDDNSDDGHGSPKWFRDDSELAALSAPDPQVVDKLSQRSSRSCQEHTAVESLSPDKKLMETESGSGERPLFFRRTNVGRSPMERRSSYSSFLTSSSSSPSSPTARIMENAASRSSRAAELEKEIIAMRTNHENIVAVLRATNKQHAANVLELRAQVAALTDANLWLERQLTAKGELVRELREMEKQQQRDSVSVNEVQKILELKDTQIQTLEREMGQLRLRLARLESDKDSQLYQQYQHYEVRRERDEKRINDLRKEVLSMVRLSVDCERGWNLPSRLTREMLSISVMSDSSCSPKCEISRRCLSTSFEYRRLYIQSCFRVVYYHIDCRQLIKTTQIYPKRSSVQCLERSRQWRRAVVYSPLSKHPFRCTGIR